VRVGVPLRRPPRSGLINTRIAETPPKMQGQEA
jgi:hypothetical protein